MSPTRYGGGSTAEASVAPGWRLEELSRPAALVGANGLRYGPTGELVVAQAYGSEITALDVTTGQTRAISSSDDAIVTPDDLAFDSHGAMYVTELTVGRVSRVDADGSVTEIDGDIPAANGIAVHADRLFAGEYRDSGRIFELFGDGRERRLVADGLFWPNGMAVGPDGYLYFPSVLAGEIYRVGLDGGAPERVITGLALPSAVKVDDAGIVWAAEVAGTVITVDPRSGSKRTIAQVAPALDNLAFGPDGELYISNLLDGRITVLRTDGGTRELVGPGMIGPSGIDVASDGSVYLADVWAYAVVSPDGTVDRPSNVMAPGFPGVLRAIAVAADNSLRVSTTAGQIASYAPGGPSEVLASGLGAVMSLAVGSDGRVVATDADAGSVIEIDTEGRVSTLASGLSEPTGISIAGDGSCFVAESAAGRLTHLTRGGRTVVLTGLEKPNGVAISGNDLFVIDRGARTLVRARTDGGASTQIASDLPVGGAPGVGMRTAPGFAPMAPGPWTHFSDIAAGPDGSIYIGADGIGSVIVLRPEAAS